VCVYRKLNSIFSHTFLTRPVCKIEEHQATIQTNGNNNMIRQRPKTSPTDSAKLKRNLDEGEEKQQVSHISGKRKPFCFWTIHCFGVPVKKHQNTRVNCNVGIILFISLAVIFGLIFNFRNIRQPIKLILRPKEVFLVASSIEHYDGRHHRKRIQAYKTTVTVHSFPSPALPQVPLTSSNSPDYGEVILAFHSKENNILRGHNKLAPKRREISPKDAHHCHRDRHIFLKDMDDEDEMSLDELSEFYRNEEMVDDLVVQNRDEDDPNPPTCQPPHWNWNYYPVCNHFHELSIAKSLSSAIKTRTVVTASIRYLAEGASRQAWLVEPVEVVNNHQQQPSSVFPFVLKTLRMEKHHEPLTNYRRVQMEALIMERLSSSDRISDIYGHCGASTLVEQGSDITELIVPDQGRPQVRSRHALLEKQKDDVHPANNFTAEEKLEMALAMAEGIAELHGFSGGVIVNSDIHIEQWVRSQVDSKIKLNDFNNGFILKWDTQAKQYCTAYAHFGGDFHSPEEFRGDYVTEQIDVYSMGNNIHCLLTGLWQFPWLKHNGDVQDLILAGQRDHVDPRYNTRSFIEGRLVEIMERAWIHNPKKRASIFEVVEHLRETRRSWQQQ